MNMPQNKRESLIYTVLMCFVMVLWMSIYNVALQYGKLDFEVLAAAWIGFPIAYVFAMCCDWFFVSKLGERLCLWLFGKVGRFRAEKSGLCILLHGGADGFDHVAVRRGGRCGTYRGMERHLERVAF